MNKSIFTCAAAIAFFALACTTERVEEEIETEGAAVSQREDGAPLAISTFMDRAESVCPSSHPKRKADQMGFGNQHDQCCTGVITPYCTAGYTAKACPPGEAYVIVPGVDRCATPVQAKRYLARGAATCDAGYRLKVDPKVAEARLPIADTSLAAHDECCKGSTCRPPTCPAGEVLARVDGPDQCVRVVDTERFEFVGKAKCPAGLVRTNDARDRTLDVCCHDDVRANYPQTCQPLVVTKDACPEGSKVVSLLGDDECVVSK
jgi:hypothetical protein